MSRTLSRRRPFFIAFGLFATGIAMIGCDAPQPVVTYTVPTEVPEQLRVGNDRMLAMMVPKDDLVWYFKVMGPEKAIAVIESDFIEFVKTIEIAEGKPNLKQLPDGWRLGGERPMRFATIDVDTPGKQLDISVSNLPRREDWDQQVEMDVNRWRGQLGLGESNAKWADGKAIEIAAGDGSSVLVDIVGKQSSGAPAMSPPFARGSAAPFVNKTPTKKRESRLKFEKPSGWRDGEMRSMRMAAFNVGPEESVAEVTVIAAGGDLRGNVARWLGQIRPAGVPDEVVDRALEEAETVEVDGRQAQRFLLQGDEGENSSAIDATIVPLEEGFSLFVKMTGPSTTVTSQSDQMASFLKSLQP